MARPAGDISIRILHAARARFLEQGVDGASLRQIAKEAGTNIGMVYYYFKTKDDLFLAVVEEVYAVILRDVALALGDDVPVEQRIERLYQRVARLDDTEFDVMRLIMREALVSSARLSRIAQRFSQGHFPLIAATLGGGIAEGRLRGDLHPLVIAGATAALGIMPQIVHRLVSRSELPVAKALPSREHVASTLSQLLLFGIAGPMLRPGEKP